MFVVSHRNQKEFRDRASSTDTLRKLESIAVTTLANDCIKLDVRSGRLFSVIPLRYQREMPTRAETLGSTTSTIRRLDAITKKELGEPGEDRTLGRWIKSPLLYH